MHMGVAVLQKVLIFCGLSSCGKAAVNRAGLYVPVISNEIKVYPFVSLAPTTYRYISKHYCNSNHS